MSNKNADKKDNKKEENNTNTDNGIEVSFEDADEKEQVIETAEGGDTAGDNIGDNIADNIADTNADSISEDKKKDKKDKGKKREHKKLRHGAMSVIYTAVFIAVIVLINIIATIIFDKYPITFDLTKNNKYSVSEQSEEYIKGISVPVKIKIFAEEDSFIAINDYTKQANEVIKKYCRYNDNISVEYIDVDSNPNIVSEYADQNVEAYSMIVETESKDENGQPIKDENGDPLKRVRSVSYMDLIDLNDEFETEAQNSYGMSGEDYLIAYVGGNEANAFAMAVQADIVDASTADQAFISAIMAVTDPDPVVVSVLGGRDEYADITYFRKLLLANGYTVNDVNIVSEEIPEDTDLCVIPAPTVDYMPEEIDKVEAFLNNDGQMGKNLIYIASLSQQQTPNIDEFLEEYYIQVGSGVILENDMEHYLNYQYRTISDDISETFAGDTPDDAQILVEMARPIVLLEDEKGNIGTEAYLSSTANASVIDPQSGSTLENGKQIYAAVTSKVSFNDDGTADYSNIFVLGSDSIVSNQYMSISQYQNREYILNVTNGLTGKQSTGITIEPKVIEGKLFDITADQISLLKKIFIGVIPSLTLIIGFVIWLRRKHR